MAEGIQACMPVLCLLLLLPLFSFEFHEKVVLWCGDGADGPLALSLLTTYERAVLWCCGVVVLWCCGVVVWWCGGVMVVCLSSPSPSPSLFFRIL